MHSLIRCTLLVTLVVLPGSLLVIDEVAAQSTSTLGRVGNEALRQGDFDAAIEQYELALQATKADPRIQYNKAIAHYRKGEIDAARGLFGKVVGSADPALAARARYNMGNVDYSLATQVASQDAGAATNLLRSAISHYRGSLAANPDDPDARANIELAARFMRQLKRQQDQQQSDQQNQQQGDQQNQQQSDQSSDDSQGDDSQGDDSQDDDSQDDSQPDQSQSGDGNQDQQDQDQQDQDRDQDQQDQDQQPQDQPEQDQQSGDGSEQQQDSESQSSDGSGDSEQESGDEDSSQQDSEESESGEQSEQDSSNGQQQPPSEEPEEQQSQNGNQQQDAAQSDEQPSDPQQANQDNADDASQQPPDGELKALNEEGEGDEVPGYRPQQIQQSQKMTMQEARKMLQAVRDRDLRRRLQKLQQMRARRIPVEKDW